MQARIHNIDKMLPDALQAMMALAASSRNPAVPARTLELVHLRASQINGCSVCVDMHMRNLLRGGIDEQKVLTAGAVAAWQHAPYFTDAERAALALTECVTRIADRSDPVPDAVWQEAARHYDEKALAVLVLNIALSNTWNRLNVATGQIAGSWTG